MRHLSIPGERVVTDADGLPVALAELAPGTSVEVVTGYRGHAIHTRILEGRVAVPLLKLTAKETAGLDAAWPTADRLTVADGPFAGSSGYCRAKERA